MIGYVTARGIYEECTLVGSVNIGLVAGTIDIDTLPCVSLI